MPILEGTITVVQESRFQLTDDLGASHLFLLGPHAGAEPEQLEPLTQSQARVRVDFTSGDNILAGIARRVSVLQPGDRSR